MIGLARQTGRATVAMKINSSNKRGLDSKGVQFILASVVLFLQYVVLLALSSNAQNSITLINYTFLGCLAASALGLLFVHGVSRYPGSEQTSNILISFIAAYSILFAIFIMARIEYSRIIIVTSFILNNILFFFVSFLAARRRKIRIGIVPEGSYEGLASLPDVEWLVLHDVDADVSTIDAIAVDLRADISDAWDRKLAQYALNNLPVYHSKHLLESLTGKVELEHLSENSFGTLSPLHAYMNMKHAIDVLAAFSALLLLAPALAVIAIVIRIDSRGPILFRQVRVGYQGQPFRIFKFRTMTDAHHVAANALDAAKTKDGDKRVTRPGAFLRRSRLDELPQLINVLKGEMSWIGPRPEAEILSHWYDREIPFYAYRHIVRPGITGWAQVSQGHVAEVDEVKSKLHFDFYYIKHFSPWIDLLIVIRTAKTMLTGFGAR